MKFNINNPVKVKLTDYGRNELLRQDKEMTDAYPGLVLPEDRWNADSEGKNKFQLWHLMFRFGTVMYNGGQMPFYIEIELGENQCI